MWVAVRRAVLVFAAVALCSALILLSRRAADAPSTSDAAVTESYTLLASQGRLLVGAYSRFQWHHPGPLYFFLIAPFYVLSGGRSSGLNAGATALSAGAMVLVAAVLMRRRPTLAAFCCATLALFAWRASESVASPWNPHVTLLPTMALIVAAADVLAGRPSLLPIVALLASLSGQAHIALMPCVLAVSGVAFARGVVGFFGARERSAWRTSIAATLIVLAIVWALPTYEQLTGTPRGNITELWRFFVNETRTGQPLAVAVSAWSDMLVGIVRPDFYVAHGWPFAESPVHWAEWFALVQLGAVTVFAFRGLRRGDLFAAALGALLVLASGVALWSTTRIAEQIFDHDVFWITGIGVLNLAVSMELVVSTVTRHRQGRGLTIVRVASIALVGAAVAAGAWQLREIVTRSNQPSSEARSARAVADDLLAYMDRERVARPLVKIDQDAWGIAAGAILDLQKRGRFVSVEDDWVVMFTPVFSRTGREDAVVTIAAPPEHVRLTGRGVRLLSAHDPVYVHVEPPPSR